MRRGTGFSPPPRGPPRGKKSGFSRDARSPAAKALGKPKRQSKFSDGPAPKRPRCDPDATDSDDDDERDDTCACCGRSTLTAAGLAMEDVLVCDNRQCEAEVHL